MNQPKYILQKIARGEYNVIDATGKPLLPHPTSKWDANQWRQNLEMFDKMLTHAGIAKAVQKFIMFQQWDVKQYGSVEQIVRNYARELDHTDMRKMMQRPSLFYTHLEVEHSKNQEARKQYLIDNNLAAAVASDSYKHCNHYHELTDQHEMVDFGSGEFVANKSAILLLKALNEAGLRTRTHHMDENGGFVSILIEDHVRVEIKTINELHADRTQYNGLTELLISFTNQK